MAMRFVSIHCTQTRAMRFVSLISIRSEIEKNSIIRETHPSHGLPLVMRYFFIIFLIIFLFFNKSAIFLKKEKNNLTKQGHTDATKTL